MEDVQVSIDRIVVDFTDVLWDFFNRFHLTLRTHFNASLRLQEKGFKYHLHVRDGSHYLHVSYQLTFVPKSRKNLLRIECHPDSLVHFKSGLLPLKKTCREVLFVRCDVAFDIPLPITELFTLSLTGRNMHTWKGTRYSNQKHQRQVAGYCRVYDKKLERAEKQGKKISGELTRFEIVYAPKEKIPLHVLVQYPPSFNKYYLCSRLGSLEKLKLKLLERVIGMMNGELEQRQVTGYYRREIEKEMRTRPTLDFDNVAAEQWENAIAIPCAILVGAVSKVPVA
ncbi:replication initiation factor family protein [Paenibacillus sp. 481]|uniref:replication initiation factor family protein n=1 Tax=Paenibacillus sp. 481 TaxID=2835869 RepID=UPI001E42C170|nr:replication initiation factor family protein [Paenibacillus sp. 481]UHA73722.1 replication initiation factor family protein [Paenibacillus sp. 481]